MQIGASVPLLAILISFSYVYVDGLPVPTDEALKPSRYRKLPGYNCTDLYSVDRKEVERTSSELKALKEKKYDLVVLNYTVNLDCLFETEVKFVRHFIVTHKGKNVLKYAVEAEYFPLRIFGLKSAILNVNLTPASVNDSVNVENIYTLPNLTFVSKVLLGKSEFSDVCVSTREDKTWDFFLALLFIPKTAVFYDNGIICYQIDNRQTVLQTSGLVYAIYVLCLFVCLHNNLLYELVLEEFIERSDSWKVYHKDELPFSLRRVIQRLSLFGHRRESLRHSPLHVTEDTREDVLNCGIVAHLILSLPLGLGFFCYIFLRNWSTNVIYINDRVTLDYIISTYESPLSKTEWIMCVAFGILYFMYFFLYLRYTSLYFSSLDGQGEVIFTLFRPQHVFTYRLEQSSSSDNLERKNATAASQFVRSYKQLISHDFWFKVKNVSLDIPPATTWKYATSILQDERQKTKIQQCGQLACICILSLFVVLEWCFYIVCAVTNIFMNITFTFLQTFCPVMKYFFNGFAQRLYDLRTVHNISARYGSSFLWLILHILIWCGVNLFIFNTVMLFISFLLYLTIIAIPFNPSYGVPLMVIVLSLVSYLIMFYEDFQGDYKYLLDVIFEILDDHFVKKDPCIELSSNDKFDLKSSSKVRQIDAKLFNSLSKKYIPVSRKCVFLLTKVAFVAMCMVIAFNALEEAGTGIETLKLSDFFSVILLVMIPGIVRSFTGPRENLKRRRLYFEVFKYLKKLDKKEKLEAMVNIESEETDSDCQEDTVDNVNNEATPNTVSGENGGL